MMHLFDTRRHLFLRAAIDDHCVLGAQTFGRTYGIHGCVTAADDGYVLAVQDRRVGRGIAGVHEVDARQVFVARKHTVQVLAQDIHEARQTGSRANENTLETLLLQFPDTNRLADDCVSMELYAERTQTVYLDIHDAVGQTELRNTVFEHTAYLMQRLKHMHLVAVLGHIAGKGQACRTGTHYRNFHCGI